MAGNPKKRARKLAEGIQGAPGSTSGVPAEMSIQKPVHKTFSPEIRKRVVEFVRGGCYVETAVRAAGVSKSTFYSWLKKGSAGIEPYAEFTAEIEQAMGEAEKRLVLCVEAAAPLEWRAAAWKLERMYPKRYGPTLAAGIEMPIAPDAGMDLGSLSMEELRALKYLTAKAKGQLPENFIDVSSEEKENDDV